MAGHLPGYHDPVVISVRLFAVLRERAGRDTVDLELAEGATVDDALTALGGHDGLAEALERMPVVMAVNRAYADPELALREGDEVALIPPVSGGGAAVHARVTAQKLSADRVAALVGRPAAGAIVTFQGTTREVDRLEYEAYREMAEERIAAILGECVQRHELQAAAAEHRVGAVPLGETSVVVAVSAAHREEAFAGAREAIDRIKAQAPIWKREVDERRGERWVRGTAPAGASVTR
ncbi:MAG TPA: molybdenum cofactor biosynthesis protein MoaE [Solirubrobacteraceae bacterium]|jgi:molybdopterin synthase catalytic subunit|nr:molybdenum cofactor biosynthesis protein MoaE [Solirubrobacteraceae bacterium]